MAKKRNCGKYVPILKDFLIKLMHISSTTASLLFLFLSRLDSTADNSPEIRLFISDLWEWLPLPPSCKNRNNLIGWTNKKFDELYEIIVDGEQLFWDLELRGSEIIAKLNPALMYAFQNFGEHDSFVKLWTPDIYSYKKEYTFDTHKLLMCNKYTDNNINRIGLKTWWIKKTFGQSMLKYLHTHNGGEKSFDRSRWETRVLDVALDEIAEKSQQIRLNRMHDKNSIKWYWKSKKDNDDEENENNSNVNGKGEEDEWGKVKKYNFSFRVRMHLRCKIQKEETAEQLEIARHEVIEGNGGTDDVKAEGSTATTGGNKNVKAEGFACEVSSTTK